MLGVPTRNETDEPGGCSSDLCLCWRRLKYLPASDYYALIQREVPSGPKQSSPPVSTGIFFGTELMPRGASAAERLRAA